MKCVTAINFKTQAIPWTRSPIPASVRYYNDLNHAPDSAPLYEHYATNATHSHMLSVLQVHDHLMGISSPHSQADRVCYYDF